MNQISVASPIIGELEQIAVSRVIASGNVAQGPEVAAFEHEFVELAVGSGTGVAVNSGTSALHLALLAAGVGPGDEVIVPSFTFAATANSVALTGATPVFADIDLATFNLDPADALAKITPRTRAIMPVHLYGLAASMREFAAIAAEHSLMLFEDCAQAHMASIDGQRVGTFGAFGAFSFYPTKNMTCGEGGLVSTSDPEIDRVVRLLRNQGMERRYENECVGFNNRMTDIHAAIGRVQLTRLKDWTSRRQENATRLTSGLEGVITPYVPEGHVHVYHQYTIRLEGATATQRDAFAARLREEYGIGTGIYYPVPNHRLPSLAHFAPDLLLPVTERAAAECLSLPVHPALAPEDIDRIIEGVNAVVKAGA